MGPRKILDPKERNTGCLSAPCNSEKQQEELTASVPPLPSEQFSGHQTRVFEAHLSSYWAQAVTQVVTCRQMLILPAAKRKGE